MKHRIITNTSKLLLLALFVALFGRCAATRPISDVALGAGGAFLGDGLSNGDPLATAAGAAGGVIVSETLHYAAKKHAEKAYAATTRARATRSSSSIGSTFPCRNNATRSAASAFIPCNCPSNGLTE